MDNDNNSSRTSIGESETSSGAESMAHQLFATPENEESPLRGLYLDLLGCLSGENRVGPQNRKAMTGFSQILNMITDVLAEQHAFADTEGQASTGRIHELIPGCSGFQTPQSVASSAEVQPMGDTNAKMSQTSNDKSSQSGIESLYTNPRIPCGDGKTSQSKSSKAFRVISELDALQFTASAPSSVAKKPNSAPQKLDANFRNQSKSEPAVGQTLDEDNEEEEEDWQDKTPLNIGGTMITKLLDNFVDVAYHFTQRESEGAAKFRNVEEEFDTEVETDEDATGKSLESALKGLKNAISVYHDCCIGSESVEED